MDFNWRNCRFEKEIVDDTKTTLKLSGAIQMLIDHQRIITVVTGHSTLTHFHVFNRWTRAFQRVS